MASEDQDQVENIAIVLDKEGIPEKVVKANEKKIFTFDPEDAGKEVFIEYNSE